MIFNQNKCVKATEVKAKEEKKVIITCQAKSEVKEETMGEFFKGQDIYDTRLHNEAKQKEEPKVVQAVKYSQTSIIRTLAMRKTFTHLELFIVPPLDKNPLVERGITIC